MQARHGVDFCLIKQSLAIWVLIIPLAIANGFVRNSILEPFVGKYALPVSGITLCAMIFILCWLLVPRLGTANQKTYFAVGIVWAVLAAVFECVMGIFLFKDSWYELMSAYNPSSGNLWLFVLLCIGVSPWITAKIHSKKAMF